MKNFVIPFFLLVVLSGCNNSVDSTSAEQEVTTTNSANSSLEFTEVADPASISPDEVFTFVCELVEQKPELVSTTCADLGEGVFDISWDTWSASGASGTGTYSVNDCEPSCADGTRLAAQVTVSLDRLVTDGERYYLVDFSYQGNEDFPAGYPKQATWDLAQFYSLINN